MAQLVQQDKLVILAQSDHKDLEDHKDPQDRMGKQVTGDLRLLVVLDQLVMQVNVVLMV